MWGKACDKTERSHMKSYLGNRGEFIWSHKGYLLVKGYKLFSMVTTVKVAERADWVKSGFKTI